jgi:hypothetical protein
MLDIFAPEITALDAELIRLQELMESKRQEQTLLKELGFEANSTINAIASLKQKVAAVKVDAIASLKSAVLSLFTDGGDDGGGNQPTDPTSTPDPTNPASQPDENNFPVGVFVPKREDEPLEGELDASEEVSDEQETGLIYHPDNKAVMYVCFPGGKLSVWIGFEKKAIARSWHKFIDPMAEKIELIPGDAYKWQLFIKGLSMAQITKLAQCDFTECHRTEVCTATPPAPLYRFQPPAIQIGTKVTKPNSEEIFEATSLVANKIFFAKSALTGERKLFSIDDVKVLHDPLPEGTPQYATVLLAECPWKGKRLQIVAEGEGGYTLATPQGNYWYRRDCVELFDEAIEAIADATEPVTKRPNRVYPAFGSAPGGFEVEIKEPAEGVPTRGIAQEIPANPLAPIQVEFEDGTSKEFYRSQIEIAGVIGKGDIVEIISDRYPQYLGQVGTVEEILKGNPDTPIQVRSPRGTKLYHRSDLKLISKALSFPSESAKELVAAGAELDF